MSTSLQFGVSAHVQRAESHMLVALALGEDDGEKGKGGAERRGMQGGLWETIRWWG